MYEMQNPEHELIPAAAAMDKGFSSPQLVQTTHELLIPADELLASSATSIYI